MPNSFFRFKQFTVHHDRCAMKVTTDGCLFGAWCAAKLKEVEEKRALDIGTGTGLLSLMVAQKSGLHIDAVELDATAAEQALENVTAAPWPQQIKVHTSDIKDFMPAHRYPFIFSNPPFYENELESDKAKRNLAHHGHGLKLSDLLLACSRLLEPNGDLYLLLPYKREQAIMQELSAAGFYICEKITVHPSVAHPPFRLMFQIRKAAVNKAHEEHLYIRDNQNQYTETFIQLLKDYYLYL